MFPPFYLFLFIFYSFWKLECGAVRRNSFVGGDLRLGNWCVGHDAGTTALERWYVQRGGVLVRCCGGTVARLCFYMDAIIKFLSV